MTSLSKKRPIFEIPLPGFIKVAVWKTVTEDGRTFYKYGPNRRYKDDAGK